MIDIHHHLLPEVDDGAKDLAMSVAMVQMAVDDGITHIVATPHANHAYRYDRAQHEALLQRVREALPVETAARVKLGLGCDFHLNFENVEDARAHRDRYTINQTEYLLIELADFNIPISINEVIYNMRVDGLTPILTHPERNISLQRTPERLHTWVESGLLLQVTAGSLTGKFGGKAESMAWKLLESGSVHFLATDAHDTVRRPPQMSAARGLLAKRLGDDAAELLCTGNPLAVFEGRPLPPQAKFHLGPAGGLPKRAFWKRMFGRH